MKREDGGVYEWRAEEQVYPIGKELKDYLESRKYKRQVRQGMKDRRFTIDWDGYERKLDELIKIKLVDKK
jgi:hypothetical protein